MAKELKILVTGGAGFLGSHLCEYLLNQGHQVICLDNFFTSKKENIAHLLKNPNFKLIRHNINYPLPEKKIGKIDRIYNLACPASPIHYQFDPVETVKTNVVGVVNVLEFARKMGARALQASTSEVYGDPKEHPQKETYRGSVNPIGPRACYDEGKRCAETLFMDYYRQYGLEIKIVRIFNTYGPRMAVGDGRVVSNFIVQALSEENITIYGDGKQTRSFQYVSDTIEAMVKMMETTKDIIGPINIGNPQEITINDLAEKILSLTKSEKKLFFLPLPENDPIHRQPDISLAKKILGWEPKISLDEGLIQTINYFRGFLKHRERRVLIFTLSYLPFIGGAELTLSKTIENIPEIKFDIITANLDKKLPLFENEKNINIYRIGGGSKLEKILFPLKAFLKAARLHRKNKYHLVWANNSTYAGFAALLMKLAFPKINYFLSIRESTSEKRLKFLSRIFPWYKLVYQKADFIQVAGSSFEKRVRQFGYKGMVSVISGAIDIQQFQSDFCQAEQDRLRNKFGIKPGQKVIVSISHFADQDGIEPLIYAISFLKDINAKFLIIGGGSKRKFIEQTAESLGIKNKICFTGYLPNPETIKILRIADILVRPAIFGGSGITILEAMAAKTAVISTLSGGANDFLIDNKTGLIIENLNPERIAEKIKKLIDDEQLRNRLVAYSEEIINRNYYWEKIHSKIRNILERLLFIG